jgi:hypothetical protein
LLRKVDTREGDIGTPDIIKAKSDMNKFDISSYEMILGGMMTPEMTFNGLNPSQVTFDHIRPNGLADLIQRAPIFLRSSRFLSRT